TVQQMKVIVRHIADTGKHLFQINANFDLLLRVESFGFALIKNHHAYLHRKRFQDQSIPNYKEIGRNASTLKQYPKYPVLSNSLIDTEGKTPRYRSLFQTLLEH